MILILDYLRPYYKNIALGIVIKFIGTLMDLVIPRLLKLQSLNPTVGKIID